MLRPELRVARAYRQAPHVDSWLLCLANHCPTDQTVCLAGEADAAWLEPAHRSQELLVASLQCWNPELDQWIDAHYMSEASLCTNNSSRHGWMQCPFKNS